MKCLAYSSVLGSYTAQVRKESQCGVLRRSGRDPFMSITHAARVKLIYDTTYIDLSGLWDYIHLVTHQYNYSCWLCGLGRQEHSQRGYITSDYYRSVHMQPNTGWRALGSEGPGGSGRDHLRNRHHCEHLS
jgi:hypothetical protein